MEFLVVRRGLRRDRPAPRGWGGATGALGGGEGCGGIGRLLEAGGAQPDLLRVARFRSLGPTTRFADERVCDRLVELVIRRAAKRRIGARVVSTDQLAIPATASSSFTTWSSGMRVSISAVAPAR